MPLAPGPRGTGTLAQSSHFLLQISSLKGGLQGSVCGRHVSLGRTAAAQKGPEQPREGRPWEFEGRVCGLPSVDTPLVPAPVKAAPPDSIFILQRFAETPQNPVLC